MVMFLRKYTKAYGLGLQSAMEYRINFLLSILSALFPIIIQFFLWTAIFSSSDSNLVYGYTYQQMIVYTVLAGTVSKVISTGIEWEVSGDIKEGGLSKFLIQPIGYFRYKMCCLIGTKTLHLVLFYIIAGVLLSVLSLVYHVAYDPFRILCFVISVIFALFLNMSISFVLSTVAFWLTESWAVFLILSLAMNIASGGVFPLNIFGDTAMRVFQFLPFQYIIFFPINILNGKMLMDEILLGIAVQLLWIVPILILSKALWKVGMKKYIAAGG